MNWYKKAQENSEWYTEEVARNPNTSPEILAQILSIGKDDLVSRSAAMNPNAPPDSLAEVLSRGNDDDVSQYAAQNPNALPRAKIKWMMDPGKIKGDQPH